MVSLRKLIRWKEQLYKPRYILNDLNLQNQATIGHTQLISWKYVQTEQL